MAEQLKFKQIAVGTNELSDFIDGLEAALDTLEALTELAPDPDDAAEEEAAAEEE